MIILHVYQWIFVAICVPLLALLVYALIEAWRDSHAPAIVRVLDEGSEYHRGYFDGWDDGYEAAGDEDAAALAGSYALPLPEVDDDAEAPS